MSRTWANLPDGYFIGKFVSFGFPAYDPTLRAHIKEFGWVKVTGISGSWLVGQLDSDLRLRPDIKRGEVIHFYKEDIEKVLGGPE